MSQAPHRAYRLTLKLEADTLDDLGSALMNMSHQVERGELTVGVSGGPSSGAIYELLHDPAQTHELYFAEVRKYLDERAASTPQPPAPPTINP